MAGQAIAAALTGLDAAKNAVSMVSGNIANEQTTGYKAFQQMLAANAGSSGTSSSGVTGYTRLTVDQQGSMSNTGISTDIAINGKGMFVVSDPSAGGAQNSVYFTKNGSYRTNDAGQLALPSGELLLAWQLDDNGNLPPGAGTTASLSPVVIQQLVSQATATSNITLELNLDSKEQVAGKGQVTLDIANTGSKKSPYNAFINATDVLYPNSTNSLTVGEGFSVAMPVLQSDGKTIQLTPTYFTYGGFSETNLLGNANTELVGVAADNITITVGSNVAAISRGSGANNLTVMQNIVDQINQNYSSFLTARIVNNGTSSTILIAPLDANQAMSFSGTGTLQSELGLTTNTTAGTNRFASLQNITDQLNKLTGINAKVSSGNNASITLNSSNPLYFKNYQPLGRGSDFLAEFNIPEGYIKTAYNPYDLNNNMAHGAFIPDYKKDVVIYDAMGNSYNFVVSFLKIDVNQWAAEIYALDTSVTNNGRIDGLIQAGIINFDNTGKLASYTPAVQSVTSGAISNAGALLGATNGQTLTIQSGSATHNFTYGDATATGSSIAGAGTLYVTGSGGRLATDTLAISCGSISYTFTRGAGATDLAVMQNVAAQINATTGPKALKATVNNLGAGNYSLSINPVDITEDITITAGSLGTDLGIVPAGNVAADTTRFSTLYELAERINETSTGGDPIEAKVIINSSGLYEIKIQPENPASYLTFGGTSAVINSPLGTGVANTIHAALGLQDTTATNQLTPLGQDVTINWSNSIQASPNTVNFNFGTIGNAEAISQINQDYITRREQNDGAVTGELNEINIDGQGNIVASFTNGKVRNIYKLAIANFTNFNGLTAVSNTLFATSKDSGPMTLVQAGENGAGTVLSGTLEGSNVEVANELANLIQAQTWYQANAKVINIDNTLFDELIHRTYA